MLSAIFNPDQYMKTINDTNPEIESNVNVENNSTNSKGGNRWLWKHDHRK